MEISQSNNKKYKNAISPTRLHRFGAFLIDTFVVSLFYVVISIISISVFNKSSYTNNMYQKEKECALVCYQMHEESHLVTYNGTGEGEKHYQSSVEQEQYLKNIISSHIIHSFNTDNTYFISKGITKLEFDESIKEASFDVDNLAYFYYNFVKNNNDKYFLVDLTNKTYQQYYFDLFNKYIVTDAWTIKDTTQIPLLKGEKAYQIYQYIKNIDESDGNKEIYTSIYNQFNSMWNDEFATLTNSPVYSENYIKFSQYDREVNLYSVLILFISFLISFLVFYFLPMLLSKNHYSLGKRIEHIYIIKKDYSDASRLNLVIRGLTKFISFFAISIIANLVILLVTSCWTCPLFYIGSFAITLEVLNILAIFIFLISLIVTIANKDSRSIGDFIAGTILIDYVDYMETTKEHVVKIETKEKEFAILDNTTIGDIDNKD